MKRVLLLMFAFGTLAATAQYNNEWIDYGKTYYKFKVGTTGLYRISQGTLSTLGLGSVPAEQFQLWRNGQEVRLFTSVASGTMSGSDFIEFWGEINDGKPDKALYLQPDFQLNEKWSLETDTAAYFLTVNAGTNLRYANTTNNVAGNVLPAESYFMHTLGNYFRTRITRDTVINGVLQHDTAYNVPQLGPPRAGKDVYISKLNPGKAEVVGGEYLYVSSYDKGEGWSSPDIRPGVHLVQRHKNLQAYSGGPSPVFRINLSGNAVNFRRWQVRINGDSIAGQAMDFFNYSAVEVPFSLSLLTSNTASVEIRNICAVSSDRMVAHRYEIVYPRLFNFNNQKNFYFELDANTNGNYLEISSVDYGAMPPVLYDITNGKRYLADISNPALVKFALEPSSVARQLRLVSQDASNIRSVPGIETRNFINYGASANQGDYLIISHPALFTGAGGSNPVDGYRQYRSSAAGGGYNAKIYLADELVDQFGFGIKSHPISIRNFLLYATATYSTPPKFVFLLGRGVSYNQFRPNEYNPDLYKLHFVPTFGHPAGDNLLSSLPTHSIPQIPIGRLSAINASEVQEYLNKMIQFEAAQALSSPAIDDKGWMKNVVHVVGASEPGLQALLDNYMTKYKLIVSDTTFGAKVTTFTKSSTDVVETLVNDQITGLFEEGISQILYFGHSSSSTLEFNLDDPSAYNNSGKYPVFVALGCNAGNFFNFNTIRQFTKETLSEKFVLAPDRGSIAFIASTHFGIVHYLDILNTRYYNALSTTHYGKTLGEIQQKMITEVFNLTSEGDPYARLHCEQSTLHGDPAIRLNPHEKPDYVIEDHLVKTTPSFISVAETTFTFDAKALNIGRAVNKDIAFEVVRTYPNQISEIIYKDTIPGTRYADSISLQIPIIASRDKGLNKITVRIDADNAVDELYENNNIVIKDVFIYEDEARPVFPHNYAIVNQAGIKFIGSVSNPFSAVKQYTMEIDTTEKFNSPLKRTQSISAPGGILEFNPGMSFTNNTVYYWRIGVQASGGQMNWNTSSFVYLPASEEGYNQSHVYQHKKSGIDGLLLDSLGNWKYDSIGNNLFIRNAIFPTSATQNADFYVTVNEVSDIAGGCFYNELMINVFNPFTLKPWKNDYSGATGLYNSLISVCGFNREYNFEYLLNSVNDRKKAMDFLDTIPDGHLVVVRSNIHPTNANNTYPSVWKTDENIHGPGNSLYHRLFNQGFTDLDSINRQRCWLFVYKKNGQGNFEPQFVISEGSFDKINLSVNYMSPDSVGYITSPTFGPASAWKQLFWDGDNVDTSGGDHPVVEVIGVDAAGTETSLITGLDITQQTFDISSIDVGVFPYLKLRMRNIDSIHFTPYKLDYWRVTYDPVPEGAVAPNIYFTSKDSAEMGEPVNLGIAFKNISTTSFDSLSVKVSVIDRDNIENIIPVPRQKPLVPEDTLKVDVQIDTRTLPGQNFVKVNFNPDYDQPEHYLFNNFIFRNLYVKPDSLSPVLDVTFDGVHILNRDIVSSKPEILVKLKDEQRWMLLDTTRLTLKVRYPDGTLKDFFFNSDTLKFNAPAPAPSDDNTATINFTPNFHEDGEYELIIAGKDMSENKAGNIEYRVAFQVINTAMISNMLNYPNPFTSSTAFVFTITGSEVPQNIRIQILTITGKVVREITKDELGPLHIGRNITEFKWDGTDQYGQKLANGIYLYRVLTNHNGKSLEKYKAEGDDTDKYFNKGYGKMYLMR